MDRMSWGKDSREAMGRLCELFPSLREVPGADPWDPSKMLAFACSGVSHGEALAARFVLGVWNSTVDWNEEAHQEGLLKDEERLKPFDLFEAFAVWDGAHWKAFLAWANHPFSA